MTQPEWIWPGYLKRGEVTWMTEDLRRTGKRIFSFYDSETPAFGRMTKDQRLAYFGVFGVWLGGSSGMVYGCPTSSEKEAAWESAQRPLTWRSPNGVHHIYMPGRPCFTCGRATVPTVVEGHASEH
jgi:hypothetical protein